MHLVLESKGESNNTGGLMANRWFERILTVIFVVLICLIFGAVISGQVLGFFRIYEPLLVIVSALVSTVVSLFFFFHMGGLNFLNSFFNTSEKPLRKNEFLTAALYFGGIILFVLVFFIPLVLWPYSPVNDTLTWDAGLYHFPKAIEMYKSGSAWDLSIAYGDYPFGYESLLGLALCLTNSEALFGSVHAVIALFLLLSLWLLANRYTKISSAVLFFLCNLLLLSGLLNIDSNIWWIFKYLVFTIGKNDLFLGACTLALLLFAPIGIPPNRHKMFVPGAVMISMITISTKPNGVIIVGFVWLVILIEWLINSRSKQDTRFPLQTLTISMLIIAPGLLWMARNLIAVKAIFSSDYATLQSRSIAGNLTNPYFYNHIEAAVIFLLAIFVTAVVMLFWRKRMSWTLAATYLILMISFSIGGPTAFTGSTQAPAQISWRFGVNLLAYAFLLLLVFFDPIIDWIYERILSHLFLQAACIALVITICGLVIWQEHGNLKYNPNGEHTLQDQFHKNVGAQGYFSAYDYVRKNIRDSIIYVENGLPYYVYGPSFSNSVSRQESADYLVVFQTNWGSSDYDVLGYSDLYETQDWNSSWVLVYQDSQGRVYQQAD